MSVHSEIREGRCLAKVSGDMTIYSAIQLKNQLAALLPQATELEVNLSDVSEFDSAGVQLLLWLKREAGRSGKVVRFAESSLAVKDVIEIFNLAPELGASER